MSIYWELKETLASFTWPKLILAKVWYEGFLHVDGCHVSFKTLYLFFKTIMTLV